ncbi:NAD(P)-dependent oxidoreductase [candidate division WS5 bacterium]|uniref:NAD(P)-dependent oxidoreductase n=1 Tax=candidate division WS5 bacterium TaxID=2093353 RepID=A0A419DFD3_9BACT|nr:MAG: NAD(P)-dependent oxidoreductase [candidate division WS5 bacterium]
MKDKKKILVFGASGFIGTYLIDELLKNHFHVIAADISDIGRAHYEKQGVSFEIIDVTNKPDIHKLPDESVDAVINLACVQPANVSKEMYNPVDYINVNVIGTLNLLEYCRISKVPKMIIATSHRNTKGLWKKGRKIREEEGRAIDFSGEYAMFSISESAAEDCIAHYSSEYGLQGIVFRLPPVYGYGPHTVIYKNGVEEKTGFQAFIDHASSGRPIEIWGDPDIGRDIIYVKDVVNAFVFALNSTTAKGLYNICSGRTLSLKQQAEETLKVFGKIEGDQKVIFRPERKNSIDPFLYNNEKAKRELGWSPKYCFSDLLMDYKKEMESGRFQYLIEKRQQMLKK